MMRFFYKCVLLIPAAVMVLAGCNKQGGRANADEITIKASIGAVSKVYYASENESRFTDGDKILVYGWMGSDSEVPEKRVVDGVVNTFDGTGWNPEKQMLWKTTKASHYFLGIYPVRNVTDFKADPYTLNPDNYTESDLLIATNLGGVTSEDGPVALAFDHAMAKLVVNLKFRSQWEATPTVSSVKVLAQTEAKVNYISKAVTAEGTASAVGLLPLSSAPDGYALSYSGLQVPQNGVRKVTVTIDNKEYIYEAANDIALTSGKFTTLGLTVGRDKIELDDITVTDWQPGTVISDAETELLEDVLKDFKTKEIINAFLQKCDTNHDGILSRKEAEAVTSLDISSMGIGSPDGLWVFPNMTHLYCYSNKMSFLRLQGNCKLEYVDCRDNPELFEIQIWPGQTIKDIYLPEKNVEPIDLTVNGQYALMQESSKPFSFTAELRPGVTAESITWVSNMPGFQKVTHQIQGTTDVLSFDKISGMGSPESGKLYKMYAEMPDGTRSNAVRFGTFGKDPIIYFEKPAQHIECHDDNSDPDAVFNNAEKVLFSVFFYPGEGESGTPSIKTTGEGCNRSFNSGVKIQEDESVHWNKIGEKQIIVYFETNGKKTSDTLYVNVVRSISIREVDHFPIGY
ncbi:MAG: fimbrillin family protein [Bacteroidales bacterium]|nr:fimbrillin family protein [Bacteroidales bacterium]